MYMYDRPVLPSSTATHSGMAYCDLHASALKLKRFGKKVASVLFLNVLVSKLITS